MKLHRIIAGVSVIGIIAGCAALNEGSKEKGGAEADETVTLAQVPPAVKEAIKAYASESQISKIEKGDVDGKIAYEFAIPKNGKDLEVTIYPDGTLLGTEEVVVLSDVPAAAQMTINKQAAGNKIESVEKAVEHGVTTYEAIIDRGGKKVEVAVAPDGKLVGTEAVKAGGD